MSQGDRWRLPSGLDALELGREGRSGEWLIVSTIDPKWPFPAPPHRVLRAECKKLPSRYLRGAMVEEPARW